MSDVTLQETANCGVCPPQSLGLWAHGPCLSSGSLPAPLPQSPHLFSSHSGPGVFSPAFWSTMSDHTTATLYPLSSLRGKCRPGVLSLRPYLPLSRLPTTFLLAPSLRPSRKPASSRKSSWCLAGGLPVPPGLHMTRRPGARAGYFHQTQGLENR